MDEPSGHAERTLRRCASSLQAKRHSRALRARGQGGDLPQGRPAGARGDPARWFGFVTEGCFKYVTYGISDDKAPIKRESSSLLGMGEREEARPKVKEHITWFSFEGEFAGDYPNCLDGRPAQTTIEAMVPTRVLRVVDQGTLIWGLSKEQQQIRESPDLFLQLIVYQFVLIKTVGK